jgi:hypothetical protein
VTEGHRGWTTSFNVSGLLNHPRACDSQRDAEPELLDSRGGCVRLSPKGANGWSVGGFTGTPAPGASPRPTPSAQPTASFVSGQVTAVSGPSITVLTQTNGSQTVNVPTTAAVTLSSSANAAALQVGQCLRATGARNSSGNVQATTPDDYSSRAIRNVRDRASRRGSPTVGRDPASWRLVRSTCLTRFDGLVGNSGCGRRRGSGQPGPLNRLAEAAESARDSLAQC